jgi:flavin-dependent dehydrogenase
LLSIYLDVLSEFNTYLHWDIIFLCGVFFMKSFDVCVVGGGFSGLYISSMIDGDLHIFEEHSSVGFPMHCAGIISPRTFNMLNVPRSLVEAEYHGMVIHFGDYKVYWFGKPLALRVDRVGLERYLYDKCCSLGHVFHFNSFVSNVDPNGFIYVGDLKFNSKLIILAEGSRRVFSRRLGLVGFGDDFYGFQALIRGGVGSEFIHVYIDRDFSDYFSWFIPIGDDRCIVGLMVRNSMDFKPKFNALLKRLEFEGLLSKVRFERFFGGLIIRGPIGSYGCGRVLAIGDSIQMSKPLTGGGLYPICLASKVLSKLINSYLSGFIDLSDISALYKPFFHELSRRFKLSFKLVKLLSKLNYRVLEDFIVGGCRLKLHANLLSNVDYDEPLYGILEDHAKLVKFFAALLAGLIP